MQDRVVRVGLYVAVDGDTALCFRDQDMKLRYTSRTSPKNRS